jgi:hypothetical protein
MSNEWCANCLGSTPHVFKPDVAFDPYGGYMCSCCGAIAIRLKPENNNGL